MFSNPEKNLLQFGINEGMSVADFGVGSGHYALSIARKVGDTGKVYCIDVMNEMLYKVSLEAEQQMLHNIEFIWSNLENEKGSTIKTGSIEAVIIANTFFEIEKKIDLVAESLRILKEKGRVLLVDWQDSFAGMGPHKDYVVKKEDAIDFFVKGGFEVEREIDAGDHHYGIVFRKK